MKDKGEAMLTIIARAIIDLSKCYEEDKKPSDAPPSFVVNVSPEVYEEIRVSTKTTKNKPVFFHGVKMRSKKALLFNQVEIF